MPASDTEPLRRRSCPASSSAIGAATPPMPWGASTTACVSEFGKARVFKDVDSIPLGQDFRGHLNDIVGGCAAVLAIIGPKWTDIRNEAGNKRLDDPDDFVRIELEAALARSVPVVPVLVGHAPMPGTFNFPHRLRHWRSAIDRSAAGSGFSQRCNAAGVGAPGNRRSECAAGEGFFRDPCTVTTWAMDVAGTCRDNAGCDHFGRSRAEAPARNAAG